jgi:hypothetical protein
MTQKMTAFTILVSRTFQLTGWLKALPRFQPVRVELSVSNIIISMYLELLVNEQ